MDETTWAKEREAMVALIRQRGVRNPAVLEALMRVPRHHFVPLEYQHYAYGDHPLPIGYGQTISQPYIVALMTEALHLQPKARVLEIGTGSGYQAAILAEMGMEVYSVEKIPELHAQAQQVLERLGYRVHLRLGDGYAGWEEYAPYDGVVVTAAPVEVPPALIAQLNLNGYLVIPVGPRSSYQTLWQIRKTAEGLEYRDLGGVAFVPLVPSLGGSG